MNTNRVLNPEKENYVIKEEIKEFDEIISNNKDDQKLLQKKD